MRKLFNVVAALFVILSVSWVYKVNFLDKPVTVYSPPALIGEVQTAGRIEAQVITDSARAGRFLWPSGSEFRPFEMVLPVGADPVHSIRIDPLPDRTGTVRLRNVQFRSSTGKLTPIPVADWDSLNPRFIPKPEGDVLTISRLGAEDYPALLLKTPGPLDTAVDGLPRVTSAGLLIFLTVCGLFDIADGPCRRTLAAWRILSAATGNALGDDPLLRVLIALLGLLAVSMGHLFSFRRRNPFMEGAFCAAQ